MEYAPTFHSWACCESFRVTFRENQDLYSCVCGAEPTIKELPSVLEPYTVNRLKPA